MKALKTIGLIGAFLFVAILSIAAPAYALALSAGLVGWGYLDLMGELRNLRLEVTTLRNTLEGRL